jgi:hypothetical protein
MVYDLLKKGGDPMNINELKKRDMKPTPFMIIADVINMFRLVGVCVSIKSPLAPLFERGGGNTYTPALLVATIGVLIWLQACISSPFDKGGQGDLIKGPIGNYF